MKQIFNNTLLYAATAVLLLAGCSKEPSAEASGERVPIILQAQFGTSASAQGVSAPRTKAPVDGTNVGTLAFVRADERAAGTYDSYAGNDNASDYDESTMFFNHEDEYYLTSGLKTKFTGWYPRGASDMGDASATGNGYYDGTARTVTWMIDGQQDIITAALQQGSKTSPIPPLRFDHRLTQLQFYPFTSTQSSADGWGKILKIEVLDQQNIVLYDLANDATGAVTFLGAATNVFSAGIPTGGAAMSVSAPVDKETKVMQMGDPVMIAPQGNGYRLSLRITTEKYTKTLSWIQQGLTAGTPYRVYLYFSNLDITVFTTVAQWSEVSTDDTFGKSSAGIGDFLEDGIVFYSNGEESKIFSLDEGSNLTWSTPIFLVRGDAMSDDIDLGAINVAAMKAYSVAHKNDADVNTRTTGVFATDFPAAAFCDGKNGGGVTGWRIPVYTELQFLADAYDAHKTSLDAACRAYGGTAISDVFLWSGTEDLNDGRRAWRLNVLSYDPNMEFKNYAYSVRCVKDISPRPYVGDYYYSDGSYSTELLSGQTVTGMVFWVDPRNPMKYKVMSLEESKRLWAASNSYVLSPRALSEDYGAYNTNDIMNAWVARWAGISIIESSLDAAFPAAAYCINYKGRNGTDAPGTWYLPAMFELEYLYCAYNGVAPVVWTFDYPNFAPVKTAQDVWNARMQAGGAAGGITNDRHWSSTEYFNNTAAVVGIRFLDGALSTAGKAGGSYFVRCVREI